MTDPMVQADREQALPPWAKTQLTALRGMVKELREDAGKALGLRDPESSLIIAHRLPRKPIGLATTSISFLPRAGADRLDGIEINNMGDHLEITCLRGRLLVSPISSNMISVKSDR